MTPSRPKREMSAELIVSICSMRGRAYPPPARMRSGIVFDPLLDFGHCTRTLQVHLAEGKRAGKEMDMAIGEARQHQVSARVDYPRPSPSKTLDLRVPSNSHDFVAADGQRICPRLLRVNSANFAVDDNGVCWRGPLWLGNRRKARAQRKKAPDHQRSSPI